MSSDNGIYIGCFPTADGAKQYRVAHAQNIEDVGDDYYPDTDPSTRCNIRSPEALDAFRSIVFGGPEVRVFDNYDAALAYANEWAESFSILEYGVSDLPFLRPFVQMDREDVRKILDAAWKKYWKLERRRKKAKMLK